MSVPAAEFTFDAETHTYRLGGLELPSVTQVLREMGFVDDRYFNANARALGVHVHQCCALLASKSLDWSSVHSDALPRVKAFEKFVLETGFQVHQAETPMYSERLGLAGTADLIGTMSGCLCILDEKSGAAQAHHALQLGGYHSLAADFGGLYATRLYGLYLQPNGRYKMQEYKLTDSVFAFNTILNAHKLRSTYGVTHEQ